VAGGTAATVETGCGVAGTVRFGAESALAVVVAAAQVLAKNQAEALDKYA